MIRNNRFRDIYVKYNDSFYESESQKKLFIGCQVNNGINAITVINLVSRKREYTVIDDFYMKVTNSNQLQPFTFIENYDGKIVITTSKGFLLLLYINDYNVQRLELLGNVNLPIIKIFYKKGKLNAITSGSKLILRFN